MKKKLTIITVSLILFFIFGIYFATISNAAIEIKSGTTAHTNIKVTNSYQYCYDMRSSTSTLGNNNLDPHLTLNKDWAAVAYLGASSYGSVRSKNAYSVTIGENNHYSTTSNVSGVLDLGKTSYTQTASLKEGYTANSGYRGKLEENANTKYVEILSSDENNTIGQAIKETKSWFDTSGTYYISNSKPVLVRNRFFYYSVGMSNLNESTGENTDKATYRPVIWN